jgi:imidazolonepropionase-like amidohydrolase
VYRVSALLLLLSSIPPSAQAFDSVDDTRRWAIADVSVIDVESGEVLPDRAIVIQSGVIEAVVSRDSIDPDALDLLVSADGAYAIPGLWDMHVHLRGGPELIAANERWLPQYLGFGVTTVRDAGGDLPNSVLHWKAEIEAGFLVGPRIYSALRKIDGVVDSQPGAIPVASRADIDSALDYLMLAGADFVKVYDMSLPRDLYLLSVREAEARGMKTSAHVPPWVPFDEIVDAGLDSVEHSIYLAEAADPEDRRLASAASPGETSEYVNYYRAIREAGGRADARTFQKAVDLMLRRGTAVVSTIGIEHQFLAHLSGQPTVSARREETPEPILETHEETLDFLTSLADQIAEDQRMNVRQTESLLKAASDAGVTILAGTDTGANNALLYPGDSLHAELEALVEIGISPLEALRSATINPARWMDVYPTFGSISAGAAADLVLLKANPLEDITNTRSVAAVILQGIYYDADELEQLKRLDRR